MPPFTVLILAAGSGNRFGGCLPKQYERLNGKAVLRHAIEAYLSHPAISELYVAIQQDHQTLYQDAVHDLNLPPPITGGCSRKESCYKALKYINQVNHQKLILVHDAARPFLCHKDIDNLLTALQTYPSVTLGKPVPETLRRVSESQTLTDSIDRTGVWSLQTPQGFHFKTLLSAHETHRDNDTFTDDCGVMEADGHTTYIFKRSSPNIKITWPEDLEEAEKIMAQQHMTVVGQGFDVHAFGPERVETIRLGGIDVPHDRCLTAHSDGDVVLHALTDAVLGAIGAGDIGLHFPPSDETWKDKDSGYFLDVAVGMLKEKSGHINNADITLICERPKLTPVREKMSAKVAEILGIPLSRVNIKATTTEKLGFTGREEGIACQAVICATVKRDDETIK